MVKALEQEQENYKSRLYHFKGMHENSGGSQQQQSRSFSSGDNNISSEEFIEDDKLVSRSQGSRSSSDISAEKQQIGSVITRNDKDPKSRMTKPEPGAPPARLSEMDQMKERFAKLLLGEDMSGGGKGVCSALALSNAITNLAASVFGEQSRLEPMSPDNKARWRREVDWLLSVSDHIVELVPSQQKNKDGSIMEIMKTQQRTDLLMNIPALRKLDTMLTDCYDNFKDQNEFSYVSKDAPDSEKGNTKRNDKWWLPTVKVPPNGLSEGSRKFLQYQKDCVNQVLKAAMAINAQVLSEMEVPENYIESLPKNGRASLGDLIYRSITVEYFDPDQFLSTMDLSSEHKILDLKNRMEASIVIWKRKMIQKDGKSTWGSAVSLEKRELFEERAETILLIIKQRFPGIPQSSLDISKIQFNPDVGQALLESYSRILESLAYTVMSRIEDVLYADYVTRNPSCAGQSRNSFKDTSQENLMMMDDASGGETPNAMTLSDFMGWNFDSNEDAKKEPGNSEEIVKEDMKFSEKIANIVTIRKPSYLENLGGQRSPTARH
ncbi:rop guanine nucleotide exchange factor 12 [Euphorbia lathyris]|uniref:rop guanine nucleotide exchange factor 12 n=1 Tax=Euphorbia lathyris TaxID=212925 RepID=UPI003313284B